MYNVSVDTVLASSLGPFPPKYHCKRQAGDKSSTTLNTHLQTHATLVNTPTAVTCTNAPTDNTYSWIEPHSLYSYSLSIHVCGSIIMGGIIMGVVKMYIIM